MLDFFSLLKEFCIALNIENLSKTRGKFMIQGCLPNIKEEVEQTKVEPGTVKFLLLFREHSITSFCFVLLDVLYWLSSFTVYSTQVKLKSQIIRIQCIIFSINKKQDVQQTDAELCWVSFDCLPHACYLAGNFAFWLSVIFEKSHFQSSNEWILDQLGLEFGSMVCGVLGIDHQNLYLQY